MMKVKRERGESSRRNDNVGGGDAEDAEEEALPGVKLDRRALRSRYRNLKSDVNENKGELAQAGVEDFRVFVERAENLFQHVQKPREQITDAEVLMGMTTELLAVAKGARGKGGMSSAEFIGAILQNYCLPGSADRDSGQRLDWDALGLEACAVLRRAPGMSTMVGPMDVELKPRKAPVSRRRERPTERTQPEVVKEVDPDRPSTETDANMRVMFQALAKHQQVELARLVLNRRSFAQTIENLFALSFLVKDGRVQIMVCEDGNQVVVPENAPSHADRISGHVSNTAFVFRMDFSCWRIMQDMVPVDEEVMPHRGSVDASTATMPRTATPIRKNSRNRARETPAVATPSEAVEDDTGAGSSRRLKKRLLTSDV